MRGWLELVIAGVLAIGPVVSSAVAIWLWRDGSIEKETAGWWIQAHAVIPLAVTFRSRAGIFLERARDTLHGDEQPEVRLARWHTKVADLFSVKLLPNSWSGTAYAGFDLFGLAMLLAYYVGGLVLQNT